ncbi:MAG: energy-coupling factor transporter transmembrane component T [Candidatus Eisenbacteria bacterium]
MSAALAPAVVRPARGAARESVAPLLVGSLAGALVAGRLETAGLCAVIALVTAMACGARAPSRGWWRALIVGAVVAWLLNLYLTPGTPLGGPRLLGRAPTHEGARLGALLMVRMLGAFAAVLGLAAVWPGERAADTLAGALRPLARLGAPVAEARMMLGLALRFVPLVRLETARIARVQRLRAGRDPRDAGEWLTRIRSVVVPALTASLERADRVALALEARHYRVRPLTGGRTDWNARRVGATVVGVAVLLVAVLWRADR